MTIAGTWQDLRDQMSLKPRDLRKKCAGSRDIDHTTKNYWESGLGLFTIAFSGDFDPKNMSESAPRGPHEAAPALTSDCSVSINQPRTTIISIRDSRTIRKTGNRSKATRAWPVDPHITRKSYSRALQRCRGRGDVEWWCTHFWDFLCVHVRASRSPCLVVLN